MFLIRTVQGWVGKLLDRPSPQDEEVSTPSPQDEEVSTPSPQSGAYMIEERRVHTTALRLDWYRLLILFLLVYFFLSSTRRIVILKNTREVNTITKQKRGQKGKKLRCAQILSG